MQVACIIESRRLGMLINNEEYIEVLNKTIDYIKTAQYNATVSVNFALIHRNWAIGNIILNNSTWGNKFIDNLARDIKRVFPNSTGLSVRNLKYMKKFSKIFSEDDLDEYDFVHITWYHHMALMDKVKEREQYIWYVKKTIENGWTRDVLVHQIEYNLYSRNITTNKIQNFRNVLPDKQSELAIQTMKDPYIFDFIQFRENMVEMDIEKELINNISKLLLELGTGFAYIGEQYPLNVQGEEFYIDLLFYNTKLHCYVAIDLKTGKFVPEQAGKMNFYLSALDELVKSDIDNPSIGLILCKDENRVVAEYSLKDMSKPIGVSEYRIFDRLPKELEEALPSVEDIQSRVLKKYECE